MASRARNRLTAATVTKLNLPGVYHDGGGLYLQVTAGRHGGVRKSWLFRYTSPVTRKRREMGLGSLDRVGLAAARTAAEAARKTIGPDSDPIIVKAQQRDAAALQASRAMSFAQCAEKYIEAHQKTWRNEKHRQQWPNTLKSYAYPVFGHLPVGAIDVSLVLKVIEAIWEKKPETASRVRQRIETVLDWATVRGFRTGDNPARWRGHLDNVLPARGAIQKVQHRPSLPYESVPAFMRELAQRDGVAAQALRFTILTASRTSEARLATWDEVDFKRAVWTRPASHMKAGSEHKVPLTAAMLSLLRERRKADPKHMHIFAGSAKDKPLSDSSMLAVLERMGRDTITVHGFRTSFRTWAAEQTAFPREIAEAALAHSNGDKVEAAYQRSDFLVKRAALMQTWCDFCEGPAAQVNERKGVRARKKL